MLRKAILCSILFLFLLALAAPAVWAQEKEWQKYLGEEAGALTGQGWVGQPVSMENLRGNLVIVAFWNADVPC